MARFIAVACVCLLASACSDDGTPAGGDGPTSSAASGGGQGGGGGSGGGTDSSGGDGGSGGDSGNGGSGGDGGSGGSGGALDCSAFDDDEPGPRVTFRVTNQRATPIYYHGDECFERFRIGPEGGPLGEADLPWVHMTCEAIRKIDDWPLDCNDDTGYEIAPGASATFLWTGRLYEPEQMPIACAAAPDNPYADNCPRAVAVQPGPFKIALQLFGAATCEDLYCSVSDPFTVEQDFTYPDDTEIAIAVD